MRITFKTALIMGASRGVGRAIALKLAREGVANIGVHYYSRKEDAEKVLAEIREAGSDGLLVQGDTSDAERARTVVEEAAQRLGGCDIFVQSTLPALHKIYEHTLSTEVPLDKWQLAFDQQARAFFLGAPTAAKHMKKGGRIIALSYKAGGATGGWQPWVGVGSAKAALESMCRYFAVAMARDKITVNAVSPWTSDDSTVFGQLPAEAKEAMREWAKSGWVPMWRQPISTDAANACALLCSEEAELVTGQIITVDGGSSLMNPDFPLPLQVPK